MTNPLFDSLFAPQDSNEAVFLHLSGGSALSHSAFAARAAKIAGALLAEGLKAGDRLACQVQKSPDALALYAACARAGIVLLPLNTAYTPREIAYFVRDAEAAMLVCDPADAAVLGTQGDGTLAQAADAATQPDPVARSGYDLAAFLYTSGTTGRSKGAMLTQHNLLSNALSLRDAWAFTAQDILIHALPIFHTHGLFGAVNITLVAGGAMIWQPKFDAADVMAVLPQAITMMGVPTFYTRLLAEPALDKNAVSYIRLFVSGSAPMLPETHAQ